jgi:transcription initiation protein SPT3
MLCPGTECYRVAAKRFREFLNLPAHLDLKSNDDTTDIVGFLAFEMVRSLTVAALDVKKALEESFFLEDHTASPLLGKRKPNPGLDTGNSKRRRDSADDAELPLPVSSLFVQPPEARTPLLPGHIQDAFARMQGDWTQSRSAGMRNWRGGLVRTGVSLI